MTSGEGNGSSRDHDHTASIKLDRDLFVQADADKFFAGLRGKPYRPSNGCEGADFQDRWCAHCTRDAAFRRDPENADGCTIIADTMTLDADDPGYPSEWRWNERGQPECSAFEAKASTLAREAGE